MTFQRPGGGALYLTTTALFLIDSFRQHSYRSSESGGVLLGRILVPNAHVIVERVTSPNPADKRSRFRFFRAQHPTQMAINRAWVGSDGTQNYLGEWHTHPEDDPSPSETDLRNWDKLTRYAKFEQDALFFVIVGRVATRVWEVPRSGGEATELANSPH